MASEAKSFRVGEITFYARPYGDGMELRVMDASGLYRADATPSARSFYDDLVVVGRATWELIESLLKFRAKMDELMTMLAKADDWPPPGAYSELELVKAQRDSACHKIQNAIMFLMIEKRRVS